jgi:hypothetical protein
MIADSRSGQTVVGVGLGWVVAGNFQGQAVVVGWVGSCLVVIINLVVGRLRGIVIPHFKETNILNYSQQLWRDTSK